MSHGVEDNTDTRFPSYLPSRIVSSLRGVDVQRPSLRQAIEEWGLFVEPGFLSPDECQKIRLEMLRSPSSASGVYRVGPGIVNGRSRRSRDVFVSKRTVKGIVERLRAILQPVRDHFGRGIEGFEPPDFLLCQRGDYFKRHPDTTDVPGTSHIIRRRRLTAVIFLNVSIDAFPGWVGRSASSIAGGELVLYGFPEDRTTATKQLRLAPTLGLLVVFPAEMHHEVERVRWGKRCTIVSSFIQRKCWPKPKMRSRSARRIGDAIHLF